MYPTLFQIGPVAIHSFGVMVALAVFVCGYLMGRDARPLGIRSEEIFDFVFWAAVGGIIGARLFFIFLNGEFFLENPSEIIMLQRGGLAWQGGFVLGAAAAIVFLKRKGWSGWTMADLGAPYLALGHAIGRIGCFLNGCCYGKEAAWGIYFPVHEAHLHPTQLYEAAALTVLFFLLKAARTRMPRPGQVFAIYVIAASVIRFVVEFFRADHELLAFGLSVFQYVGIGFFFAGWGLLLIVRRGTHD